MVLPALSAKAIKYADCTVGEECPGKNTKLHLMANLGECDNLFISITTRRTMTRTFCTCLCPFYRPNRTVQLFNNYE